MAIYKNKLQLNNRTIQTIQYIVTNSDSLYYSVIYIQTKLMRYTCDWCDGKLNMTSNIERIIFRIIIGQSKFIIIYSIFNISVLQLVTKYLKTSYFFQLNLKFYLIDSYLVRTSFFHQLLVQLKTIISTNLQILKSFFTRFLTLLKHSKFFFDEFFQILV